MFTCVATSPSSTSLALHFFCCCCSLTRTRRNQTNEFDDKGNRSRSFLFESDGDSSSAQDSILMSRRSQAICDLKWNRRLLSALVSDFETSAAISFVSRRFIVYASKRLLSIWNANFYYIFHHAHDKNSSVKHTHSRAESSSSFDIMLRVHVRVCARERSSLICWHRDRGPCATDF